MTAAAEHTDGTDEFGEEVSSVRVATMLAAKREWLARGAARDEVDVVVRPVEANVLDVRGRYCGPFGDWPRATQPVVVDGLATPLVRFDDSQVFEAGLSDAHR